MVVRHITVGDELDDVTAAIRTAMSEASLVIMTGGLGPTDDDLTRQAIADVLGVSLHEDAKALQTLHALFARLERPMPDSNRRQALVPEGCEVVPNPRGTAPGILSIRDKSLLFALPGVPAEMRAMFNASVRPRVEGRSTGAAVEEVVLKCFGISEARLGDAVSDLMARGRNPLVGTTASEAVLSVRIVARGKDRAEAKRLAQSDESEVRRRVGSAIFGDGDATLAEAVGALLRQTGQNVSVAESCTGGLLAACLTEVPGCGDYFLGGYVAYANKQKTEALGVEASLLQEHGAVSEPVAAVMARACCERAGSDFALSITGIAGPEGGSPEKPVGLVFIALADAAGVKVRRFLFGDYLSRREIRDRSCKTAMNLLRLRLLSQTTQ